MAVEAEVLRLEVAAVLEAAVMPLEEPDINLEVEDLLALIYQEELVMVVLMVEVEEMVVMQEIPVMLVMVVLMAEAVADPIILVMAEMGVLMAEAVELSIGV